jgi:hypothetical protein
VSLTQTSKVRIFVSSPQDVQRERNQLDKVVRELNNTLAALVPERGLVLELWRWETDAYPGYESDGPQAVIDRQAPIANFDIFIGIMWRRFGTPTKRVGSGTEAEFHAARESWRENRRPREILFYFCQARTSPPKTAEEGQQEAKVAAFRQELSQEALVGEYPTHAAFADQIRPDLVRLISKILRPEQTPSEGADRAAQLTPDTDLEVTRRQVAGMAREYERLRRTMEPGDARTRRLEVVASRMRALALSAYPLLPDLMASRSPGERLCAVTTLQALPRADHLQWLAERLSTEKPFIGYHAALALLNAARTLDVADLPMVRDAIAEARAARRLHPDTDRDATLQYAEEEVAQRMASARG